MPRLVAGTEAKGKRKSGLVVIAGEATVNPNEGGQPALKYDEMLDKRVLVLISKDCFGMKPISCCNTVATRR